MSKFCPNCGSALDDIAVFCGSCGTRMDPPAPQPAATPVYEEPVVPAPRPAKKSKKGLVIGIIAAVLVLAIAGVAVFVLDVFGLFSNYEDALENYLYTRFLYQCEDIDGLLPEEAWEAFEEESDLTKSDFEEQLEYMQEYQAEELEYEYGSNLKFSYKVTDEEKIESDDLKQIAKALADEYGIRASSVKKGFDLEIDLTMEGSEDSDTEEFECAVIQIDSDWYVISWGEYDDEVYAQFMP